MQLPRAKEIKKVYLMAFLISNLSSFCHIMYVYLKTPFYCGQRLEVEHSGAYFLPGKSYNQWHITATTQHKYENLASLSYFCFDFLSYSVDVFECLLSCAEKETEMSVDGVSVNYAQKGASRKLFLLFHSNNAAQ